MSLNDTRRINSALIALATLYPPSPTPSVNGIDMSLGEIPIILPRGWDENELDGEPTTPNISCESDGLLPSCSTAASILTMGTFGPVHRSVSGRSPTSPSSRSVASTRPISRSSRIYPCHEPDLSQRPALNVVPSSSYQSLDLEISEFKAVPSVSVILDSETLSTLQFAPPSPLPFRFSSSFIDSSRSKVNLTDSTRCELPEEPLFHGMEWKRQLIPRTTLPSRETDTPIPPGVVRQPPSALGSDMEWLKTVSVELLIDQEGFRSIRPAFRYVGYSARRRLDQHDSEGEIVDFMPIKRQAFRFHYAPLEGLPILRRVTVNGDEGRDYISRQATLSLKTNAVYTVHGSETLTNSTNADNQCHGNSSDTVKLRWKFDYLVTGHIIGNSKTTSSGEKNLIPLTFSCSPNLLHLSQSKKVKLIHIFKKTLVPNLIAERLVPPIMAAVTEGQSLKDSLIAGCSPDRMHRRERTHPTAPSEDRGNGRPRRGWKENQERPLGTFQRHRRASSAGEQPGPKANTVSLVSRVKRRSYCAASGVGRHIMPPEELARLMDNTNKAL